MATVQVPKKVAVLGAGPSGLTTTKNLLEEGHEVICFDKSPDIGGVYRYAIDNIGVYESALLTSSAFITSFSDFPPPKNAPFYFKHPQYLQYLRDYANTFGLLPFIKLNHSVQNIKKLPDGTWQLKALNIVTQKEEQYGFDAIAVCAGVHQNLSIPDIPHKDIFQGTIMHSGHYKNANAFKDKNVVIVGGGESASDIAEEISQVSRHCALSLRRGVMVVPKYIYEKPQDFYTTRLFYSLPPWYLRMRHKEFHWPSLFLNLLLLWIGLVSFHAFKSTLLSFAHLSPITNVLAWGIIAVFMGYVLIKSFQYFFIYIGFKEFLLINQLNIQSKAGQSEQFATKCLGIVKAIASKKCILKKAIKKFTATGVEFEDGTSFQADALVFCTGYVTKFPFLGIDRLDCRNLYKNCFDPSFGSTLCFIGLSRPHIGAIPPISEMQSRWFAQILSGKAHLPPAQEMGVCITKDAKHHKENFAVISDRITGLVEFTHYMDELAGFVGCKPQLKDLWKEPFLLFRIYFNPFLASQFRLNGPHAKKELAKKILTSLPLDIFQFLYNCCFVLLNLICKILYHLGFRNFKTTLSL